MTPMRIAVGGVQHETNTFANTVTDVDFFKLYEWIHGEEILKTHRGVRTYLGGIIDKGDAHGVTLVPTFSARANPAGTIPEETYQTIKKELLSSLETAGQLDAICLSLHGAGAAEGREDLEGALLTEIRKVVGDEIPILASLDLHANVTKTMIEKADALFGVNYYPHVDCYERGKEAMEAAVNILKGKFKPTMHLTKLPMMIPTSNTDAGAPYEINQRCFQWEEKEEVADCTFFHSFSHTDIEPIGCAVLTITNNEPSLAKEASESVADEIWKRKEDFFLHVPTPAEGLKEALGDQAEPIVINETADNPGGGSPGDGTHLLKEMLAQNESRTAIGSIYDPEVAAYAHREGVGAEINVQLGGKTDDMHGEPLQVRAYVKTLTDGEFIQTSKMLAGQKTKLGKTARLQIGNVDVIVTSVRGQTFDEQVFVLHGIDVHKYNVVAVKSSQHFRAAFKAIATRIITVDAPGLSSYTITNFDYQRVRRPIFPLDQITEKFYVE